jgi:ATP-dependent Lhr-like helicase
MNVLAKFYPAVAAWFGKTFAAPTAPQSQAWPAIRDGRNVLIAAPTGSGKTLAAFLAAIDDLVRRGAEQELADETHVVYVSPLKALSNDIQRNLETPLAGIRAELAARGARDVEIRTLVRTGDTPQAQRELMRRRPPHIVVTTPESLYILLGSDSGRRMLATTRTVIVDEIHAMAGNKRGVHLALSLERLAALCGHGLTRVGLSATQKPIEEVARFLVGAAHVAADGKPECEIIDAGHVRSRDLALEVPPAPLEGIMSGEVWEQVYDRLAQLIGEHKTTLVFVNTRRLTERATRHLSERIGAEHVTAHHGSLAKELRLDAEQRLKHGRLKALVATASLELGIDIGDVDLVCQIGSPRSIAGFLQRVGRSGHAVGGTPKGRLFPLSRDDLVECTALLDSVRRGELDRLVIPNQPQDVLAQQIVAEVAAQEWGEEALFQLCRRPWPYRALTREAFDAIVRMLAEGFSTRRGRQGALIHHDAINGRLRGRRGARLTALTSGGTIPDTADYRVMLEPEGQFIGTVNEDFAIESMAGDIFQLGNTAYRILRVERGTVRVEDAQGQPPTIPFWFGEAPGRSDELSFAVSRLRDEVGRQLDGSRPPPRAGESRGGGTPAESEGGASQAQERPGGALGMTSAAVEWLVSDLGLPPPAAQQLVDYLAAAKAALGSLPTQTHIILERFFDETGGMQLVIHSPFGSRINRAWGLALRKRFCRKFNFELQAAATEDNIVLSLTSAHSFELEEVPRYLHSNSVRPVLVQALLAAPMFMTRWRWDASIALALPRFRGGKKVPAQLQRMNAEDLIAAVFPDQIACAENLAGEREVPDHPLVNQAVRDCLEEAMDVAGLERLLRAMESGEIRTVGRDLTEPSPLAVEVLSARPYAFLDDAPLEERRTQAVMSRRWLDPESAADIGKLDPEAIERVRAEAWPDAVSADELHDALLWLGFLTDEEMRQGAGWTEFVEQLAGEKRAGCFGLVGWVEPQANPNQPTPDVGVPSSPQPTRLWIAAERLPLLQAVFPAAQITPTLTIPAHPTEKQWQREEALIEIVRGRLEGLGPVTAREIAESMALPQSEIDVALAALEAEGFAMRGRFSPDAADMEWCERRLLARIHRYTVKRLRAEIEPVPARDFLRFLFEWQRVAPGARMEGPDAVAAIVAQLEGYEAPAAAWETEILPARIADYEPAWLDDQCRAGRIVWTRLSPRKSDSERGATPVRTTPIALLVRRNARLWSALAGNGDTPSLSSRAQSVSDYIRRHGASFFDEIFDGTGMLRTQVEEALAELVAVGAANADSFSGLRALLVPSDRRKPFTGGRRKRRTALYGMEDAGRWSLLSPALPGQRSGVREAADSSLEHVARTLLRRYGVVFWRLLEREAAWLPPWREILMCYRRLEARGEIRGGRFVAGFSGEQYALPEAVGLLREVRRKPHDGAWISLSGADPLNLAGILTPSPKLPALTGNRVLYRDGIPIALLSAGEVHFIEQLEPKQQWEAKNALLRRQVPPMLAEFS